MTSNANIIYLKDDTAMTAGITYTDTYGDATA